MQNGLNNKQLSRKEKRNLVERVDVSDEELLSMVRRLYPEVYEEILDEYIE